MRNIASSSPRSVFGLARPGTLVHALPIASASTQRLPPDLPSPDRAFPRERASVMISLSVLLVVCFDVALFFLDQPAHWRLTAEDGFVENLTFMFWALAGTYVLSTLNRRPCRVTYLLLAAVMIWVAGEEVSWGQRLFAIPTPAGLSAINEQHEMNFHNIVGVHEHIKSIGLSAILLLSIAAPILQARSRLVRRAMEQFQIPPFRLDTVLLIVLSVALMAIPRALHLQNVFDETGEMVMGAAFFLFALHIPARFLTGSAVRLLSR